MRLRSLTILILVVGGLIVPCMLFTSLLAPQRVPASIQLLEDLAWMTAIEQSLLYEGYDVREVQIIEKEGREPTRMLVVSLGSSQDGEEQSASDLVEDVHFSIAISFAEWPFAPDNIALATLWIYPDAGQAYAVEAPVDALVAWVDGGLEREDYYGLRQLGSNAPQELHDDN